jgi:hypothetical protein
MEPEVSLPHKQVPSTCLYPEPTQSSPYPHIQLPEDPSQYYPAIYTWVSQVVSSLRFPHQNPLHASPLPNPRYMSRPSHSSRFYYPHNIGWGVQIMKLLIMKFSPLPCYLVPLSPKYSSQQPILKHPQPTFLHQCQRPSFLLTQNNRQNYSSVYLNI